MKLIDTIKKLLSNPYLASAWTIAIIILLCIPGTMLPNEQGFSVPDFDKLIHAILFGGLVFLWCFYFSSRKYPLKKMMILFFLVFLFSNALGIALEFVQKCCIPFRDYSEADMIADMMGASLGYGACNIFLAVEKNAQ